MWFYNYTETFIVSSSNNGGRYKNQDNIIEEVDEKGIRRIRFKPLSAFETPEAVEKLCSAYNESTNDGRIDPLILISKFVLDFLSIHPLMMVMEEWADS